MNKEGVLALLLVFDLMTAATMAFYFLDCGFIQAISPCLGAYALRQKEATAIRIYLIVMVLFGMPPYMVMALSLPLQTLTYFGLALGLIATGASKVAVNTSLAIDLLLEYHEATVTEEMQV